MVKSSINQLKNPVNQLKKFRKSAAKRGCALIEACAFIATYAVNVVVFFLILWQSATDSQYTEGPDVMDREGGIIYSNMTKALDKFFVYLNHNLPNGFPQFDYASLFTG